MTVILPLNVQLVDQSGKGQTRNLRGSAQVVCYWTFPLRGTPLVECEVEVLLVFWLELAAAAAEQGGQHGAN